MEQTKALYDKRSLAYLLDVSVPTINRRMKADQNFPKPIQIGGKSFWTNAQVDDYIDYIQNSGLSTTH